MDNNSSNQNINNDFFKEINEFIKKFGIEDFFNKLSLENFNIEKIQKTLSAKDQFEGLGESLKYSVREVWKLLPNISALSAMLLIIATFNHELIAINFSVKLLMSILLGLIPLGVWLFYIDLSNARESSLKNIIKIVKDSTGKDITEEIKKIRKPTVINILPFVMIVLFTLTIFLMILLIWKIDLINLLANLLKTKV